MLYERRQLPEIVYMKHRHDTNDQYVDYSDKILNNSLSAYMYNNDTMNTFLNMMQPLTSILFDQMNIMKNLKNYIVDKNYYKNNS